jgi:hypothetical protein
MSKKPELRVAGSTTSAPTDKPVVAVTDDSFDSSKDLSDDRRSEDKQMMTTTTTPLKQAFYQGGTEEDKQMVPAPVPITKLNDIDRLSLEVAKANRRAALAAAKQAMAENEASEGQYKYFVLQLYMKYGLTERDAIGENGEIMRGHGEVLRAQNQGVKVR